MRHFRTFQRSCLKGPHTGFHFIFIAAYLGRTLYMLYLFMLSVIYRQAFKVINILNNHTSFCPVNNTLPIAEYEHRTVYNSHLSVLINQCCTVLFIHPGIHISTCGGNLGNICPEYHQCKIKRINTYIQKCSSGKLRSAHSIRIRCHISQIGREKLRFPYTS